MVELCRGRFPDTRFEVHDAHDLEPFGDGEFGFVMFAFNGIDCLEHPDVGSARSARSTACSRTAAGSCSRRTTATPHRPASGSRRSIPRTIRCAAPLRAAAWVPAAARASWNRVRLRRYEVDTDSYAIRNDSARGTRCSRTTSVPPTSGLSSSRRFHRRCRHLCARRRSAAARRALRRRVDLLLRAEAAGRRVKHRQGRDRRSVEVAAIDEEARPRPDNRWLAARRPPAAALTASR